MKSEPPPWPSSVCTTFQACSGCFSGSVPMREIVLAAEMAGRPDRTELRMLEVGAAAGMRRGAAGVDHSHELAVLGVDDRDLVAGVGGDQEVAPGAVEAAVVQEALGLDRGDLEVLRGPCS